MPQRRRTTQTAEEVLDMVFDAVRSNSAVELTLAETGEELVFRVVTLETPGPAKLVIGLTSDQTTVNVHINGDNVVVILPN